jgi:sulfur carrier protein
VNGENLSAPSKTTLTNLLSRLKISPRAVVVEKNGKIADKKSYSKNLLREGDQIEIIHMIGGGSGLVAL